MIPSNDIIEWSDTAPWINSEQVEQDLVICRALVEIFSDAYLSEHLAFRGGTALHKLYLTSHARYSCYASYMDYNGVKVPTKKQLTNNLTEKISDIEFLNDTNALLRTREIYRPKEAFEFLVEELFSKL